MTDRPSLSAREHVRIVYVLFIAATVASCAYCVVMSQFNGDFFPQPIFLSVWTLLTVLVACLAPYVVAWKMAGVIDRASPRRVFEASPEALLAFLLIGYLGHISATLLYGVGVMDTEIYTAPPAVMPFIQALNRLDPFYLGAFFILATRKRVSTDLTAILLMVVTSFFRAGLGAFAYVIITLCIKYRGELMRLFRRMPWLVMVSGFTLPMIISTLYEIRGHLRGDMQVDLSLSDMLLGRFVGRLSSFSNVAFIEQNHQSFEWTSKTLEPLFYAKQALTSLLGSGVAPTMTPERLLIAGTRSYEGYSTFMAGVPGNLIMAWYISPWVAVFNLALILGTVVAILWLSRYLGNGIARTFGLGMLFYPLTSGVANEFAVLLLNTIIFVVFTIVFSRRQRTEVSAYAS